MAKQRFNVDDTETCILPRTIEEISDFTEWNEELPKRFKYFNDSIEERNGVTYLALFVEQEIFRTAKLIFPGFEKHFRNASFYTAINLIQSFNLLPSHILEATHCIRAIRNNLAHDINIVNLDDVPQNLIDQLNKFVDTYEGDYDYVEIEDTLLSRYKTLCANIIASLRIYEPSIRLLETS